MALQTIDPSQAVITSVGSATSGGTSNSSKPVITGTADAGDIVKVYDGIKLLGSTTVAADGTWTFTVAADLKNGSHNFAAIANDAAGNFGASSAVVTVTVGTTVVTPSAPGITALTDNVGAITGPIKNGMTTDDTHPTLSGTGTAGNVINLYDGSTLIGSTTVGTDGTWKVAPTAALTNGTHDIYATQTNSAGASPHSTDISFKVDTTTPATPTTPVITNDTTGQPITPGTPTNDPTPDISGKGTPGDTITVYDNGTSIGSLTIPDSGNWSFTPSPALPNGDNTIVVIETNPAGTPSQPSAPINVVVDTSTPATPAAPAMTDVNGLVIHSGDTTADAHPTISGTSTPGDTITVYDGATPIGSTTVKPDGTWSFTPTTDMSNGTHAITVTDTNPAGTPSAHSPADTVIINSVAPAAPIIVSLIDAVGTITGPITNNMTTDDPKPTLHGTGTAGDVIKVYDGATLLGSVTVPAGGAWTFQPTTALANGPHDIYATETNAKGTSGHSTDISFTLNTTTPATPAAPVVTNDSGVPIVAGGSTNDAHPIISGTGTAGDTIKVFDNGTQIGTLIIPANGNWTYTPSPDLPNGTNAITVIETNPAGTASATSPATSITVDTTTPAKPSVPVLSDDNGLSIPAGSSTTDAHPYISGTGKAGDIITVYDGAIAIGSAKIGTDGTWKFKPATDLANGTHSISVTDTNAAGTTGPKSDGIAFTSVAVPPVITNVADATSAHTGTVPAGGVTADQHPTISGTGTPGDTVNVFQNGSSAGNTIVDATGHWSIKLTSAQSDGVHAFTATQFVTGQPQSAVSNSWSITVDTTTPAAPLINRLLTETTGDVVLVDNIPTGSYVNTPVVAVFGTGVVGDVITVYDGGKMIGSVVVSSWGVWKFDQNHAVWADGSHSITATQTNAAGTVSALSNLWSFTVDTTTPAKPSVPVLSDDSGHSIPAGSTTPDGHPIISGTGKAGDIITVYDGATAIGSTKIGTDGTWTFTPATNLANGAHSLSVTDTNAAGTTGPHSDSIAFTFAPLPTETVTITGLYDHITSSNIANGGTLMDHAPTISGTVSLALVPGETLVVLRDGVVVGNATVSGSTWSYVDSGVAVGSHTYTAYVQNSAGHSVASNGWTVGEVAGQRMFDGSTNYVRIDSSYSVTGVTQTQSNTSTTFTYTYNSTTGMWYIPGVVYTEGLSVVLTAKLSNGTSITLGTYVSTGGPVVGVWVPLNGPGFQSVRLLGAESSVASDDSSNAAVLATSDHTAVATSTPVPVADTNSTAHHVTVGEHDAFKGTTGHDTVDLNADPTSYFKEVTAHIEGSTAHPVVAADGTAAAPAVNTLHLTGDHQILDLTALTGKTAAAKISGIEVIDLGGHSNHLNLSLTDVLNLGEQDLFQHDGKQQLMVNGSNGDSVDLSNAHIAGVADGQWQAEGTAQVGGVVYNVYEHSGAHTELLVQQGVQIALHN